MSTTDAGEAMDILVRLRGRRVRFRITEDSWVTGDEGYAAEIEGYLRFVEAESDPDRGAHLVLLLNYVSYRRPTDPEEGFGQKMSETSSYCVAPGGVDFVRPAPPPPKRKRSSQRV